MKTFLTSLFLAIATLLAVSVPVRADTPAEITKRLGERQDEIADLKQAGKLGENNEGLLDTRAAVSGEERKLMNAQNKDREALYEIIAQQTGASAKQVGKQRAKQIAKQSKPGIWLQNADGEWYKK